MIGRIWRLMFGPRRHRVETEQESSLQGRVEELEDRSRRAVSAADKAVDRELRFAYEAMIGERRHANRGHMPDRRRT